MFRSGALGGFLSLGLLLGTCCEWAALAAAEPAKPVAIGAKVPNSNSLRDLHGNRRSLHDFAPRLFRD